MTEQEGQVFFNTETETVWAYYEKKWIDTGVTAWEYMYGVSSSCATYR